MKFNFKVPFSIILVLTLLVTSFVGYSQTAAASNNLEEAYYVSPTGDDINGNGSISKPFKTITKARNFVRTKIAGGMTKNITVYLRGGNYYQSSVVDLNKSDSGRDGFYVIYKNYRNEKPVIYGGENITGWKLYSDKIYMKNIGSGWKSHNLTENGVQGILARTSNSGYLKTGKESIPDGYKKDYYKQLNFQANDIPKIANITDLECAIWPNGPEGYSNWAQNVISISAIDYSKKFIALSGSTSYEIFRGSRYIIQGALELLDQAGEFYVDSKNGILYYWPRNKDINKQDIVLAKTSKVFDFAGAHNVTINGLTVSTSEFNINNQAEAMINISNSKNITVSNCELKNIGGNAILCKSDAQSISNNIISGNLIHDIGVSGVQLENSGSNTVTNNQIYNIGNIVGDGTGIGMMQSASNTISHNRIYNSKRFGISGALPNMSKNVIEYNDVLQCMTDSQDGGAIYLYRAGPGNEIRYNQIHDYDIPFSFGAGLYLDDLTMDTYSHHNLIYKIQRTTTRGDLLTPVLIKGYNNKFYNNITVDTSNNLLWGAIGVSVNNGGPETSGQEYGNNIFYNATGKKGSSREGVLFVNTAMENDRFAYSNNNLFFNPSGVYKCQTSWQDPLIDWTKWKSVYGLDTKSVTGKDPRFVDTVNGDYRLRYDSPAINMGIDGVNAEPIGLLSTFPFSNKTEAIQKLFIKTSTTDARTSYVDLIPKKTTQLTVSGRTVSGYLLPNLLGEVKFTSDSPKIASVSAKGVVTALSKGTAKITATVTRKSVTKKVDFYVRVANTVPKSVPLASVYVAPPPKPITGTKLTGKVFGTNSPKTWPDDYRNAFDNNIDNYFDTWDAEEPKGSLNYGFTGIDVGAGNAKAIKLIRFVPRTGWNDRMVGGKFQGSNTGNEADYKDIYTITKAPKPDWNSIEIKNGEQFRYFRYISPTNGWGNVAEIEFYAEGNEIINTTPTPEPSPIPKPTTGDTIVKKGNLLLNSGFESGNSNWDSWGNSEFTASNAHSGSNSMKVGTGSGGFVQNIKTNIVEGAKYTLSAWGKCAAGDSEAAAIKIMCVNDNDKHLISPDPMSEYFTSTYTQKSINFTVPVGTTKILVVVWKDGATTDAYFDDFNLEIN